MDATLGLIKCAKNLYEKANKNLKLAQKRYKKDYDRRVRFATIYRVGDYIFLD